MPRRLLILGNSAAALAAVRAIRARGGGERITMVSREQCSAYSPVLTTYYLRGQIPAAALYLCDAGSYRELDIECRFGVAAVALDTATQTVVLDDGGRLSYDALLLATGARARHLEGLDPDVAAEICYLRTIDDARRIKQRADGAGRVVVLGGGLVSLQVASAVAAPDRQVSCVIASRQVLSQNIDAECAEIIRAHIEGSANIELHFGADLTHIVRAGGGYRVGLASGEELAADLLVAGKGVVPNIDYVDPRQIGVEQGILVDDHLRTSAGNVYAAGDLAQGRNRVSGNRELTPNWINACEQGRIAGANMAGAAATFAGSMAENITTLCGLPVASVGVTRPDGDDADVREVRYRDDGRGVYRKLFLRDERLVGAVLLRDIGDVGVIRAAIAGGRLPEGALQHLAAGPARFADALARGLRGGA